MMTVLVDYLIARDGLPASHGRAYDYVLGGDGLFVAAENRYLRARIPVAAAQVRGLVPLCASVDLCLGRLPEALWNHVASVMQARKDTEVLLLVRHNGTGYQLVRPTQVAGLLRVRYRPVADAILEIHSHGRYPARFSSVDDADEQGFRIFGVVGRLDSQRPEVALRIGLYGHFLSVPWNLVFAGDIGAFRDIEAEPECPREYGDALPD